MVPRAAVVAVLAVLTGCATLQQRAAPYPGQGQSFEQMQRDSFECEGWARSTAGSGGASTAGGAVGGAVVGAGLGAALGAISGAFFGMADSGAAAGAALGGAVGGVQGAAGGAAGWDERLTTAYQNCMAARGYAIAGYVPPPAPRAPASTTAEEEATPEATAVSTRTVETRLRQLRELHQDGLITDRSTETAAR